MKYYNIDLTQFVPYGIPLNSTDKVESKNHINEFFLHGFENWYNHLFTVDDIGTLVRDYSRSCTAPYSLAACRYCTDDQLEKFIQNEGFIYYAANDHDINAKFVYDLFRYTYGTQEYLSSIAQYVSNNPDVDAELLYDGYKVYEYGIRLYGDILGAENILTMVDRILEHLKVLGTAHTRLQTVEFEDTSSEIDTYAACAGDNSCIYYESIIRQVKPKPSLDTFDPELPFCIENIGNAPVEIGLYNHSANMAVRRDCKISRDLDTWSDYTLALTEDNTSASIRKITLANKGDRVYFKATINGTPSEDHYTHFTVLNESANTKIRAGGNIMSLTLGTNDVYKTEYHHLSVQYGYYWLFKDCTSLTQLIELPSTSLSESCYGGMFRGCTNLNKAPLLPATSLAEYCYREMFRDCINLSQAPELPARLLKVSCYTRMFYGCEGLKYVKCLATDTSAFNCLFSWLLNIPSTGIFECDNKKYFTIDSYSGIPAGWTIKEINPDPDPSMKPDLDTFDPEIPFCIENIGDAPVEVGLYNRSSNTQVRTNCKISYDNSTWQNYSLALAIDPKDSLIGKITLTKGDRVYIKADLNTVPSTSHYTHLTVLNSSADTKIRARGNIASLNKGTDDAYKTNYLTADDHGYLFLFRDCASLIQVPELPATTLMDNCYDSMFYNCTSLVNAPALPATELSGACYANMFYNCASLVNAPTLPATTLDVLCYYNMFGGCTSLVQAPELLASALTNYSYALMFNGCSSLNYIKCLATDISASNCTNNWVDGVSSTGDFYAPASIVWTQSASGMPAGWTRHNA